MIYGISIVLAVALFYVLATYNKFVTTKTRIKASIQEIGNQLKRQADLIPNLVESVKGYLKHEKGIFKDLTEARKAIMEATAKNNLQDMVDANDLLQKTFGQLKVLVESTPEIKAAETVTSLMEELRDTADKVMYARRTLIDLTADYNVMVVTFPSNIIANLFKFSEEKGLNTSLEGEHLEVSKEESKSPKVKLD